MAAPLVGLQQALCSHAAVTGRFYSRRRAGFFLPTRELQTHGIVFPARTNRRFSEKLPPEPSPSQFLGGPCGALHSVWHHITIFSGKRSSINFHSWAAEAPPPEPRAVTWRAVPPRGLFSALQAGDAPRAYFSCAGKVGKSAPGRPRPPFFCLIGHLQRRCPVATEFPRSCWSFVTGTLHYALRLTVLESIGTSNDAKQTDGFSPSKGRQPKPDAQPAADQMQKDAGSVAAQDQVWERPIGQKGGGPARRGLALFRFTFVCTKVNCGVWGCIAPMGNRGLGPRRPQFRSRLPGDGRIGPAGAEPPKITACCG